jgi:hypothetical protein
LYLSDTKDTNSKVTIERLIADIDFKIIGVMEMISENTASYWDEVMEHVNKIAEEQNLKMRYTTPYELYRISEDSMQDLDRLMGKVLHKPKQEKEKEPQEQTE